jgi:hypothetical protein
VRVHSQCCGNPIILPSSLIFICTGVELFFARKSYLLYRVVFHTNVPYHQEFGHYKRCGFRIKRQVLDAASEDAPKAKNGSSKKKSSGSPAEVSDSACIDPSTSWEEAEVSGHCIVFTMCDVIGNPHRPSYRPGWKLRVCQSWLLPLPSSLFLRVVLSHQQNCTAILRYVRRYNCIIEL